MVSIWIVNVADFHLELEQSVRQPATGQHRKILHWFSEHNYWPTQGYHFDRAEEGTGQWLLDSPGFQDWIEGGKRFLWCQGDRKSPHSAVLMLQLGLGKPFSGLSDSFPS
jgi:hypothetical protein